MSQSNVPWEIIKRQSRQEVDSKQDSKVGVIKRRYPDNKYDVAVENIGVAGTCLLRISTAKPEDVYNVGDSVIIDFPAGKIAYAQIRGRSNITIPEEEEYIFGIVQLLYVGSYNSNSLYIYNSNGESEGTLSLSGSLFYPRRICMDGTYIYTTTDAGGTARVCKFNYIGQFIDSFVPFGTGVGQSTGPRDIAYYNNKLYIPDFDRHKVLIYTTSGSYTSTVGSFGTTDGKFDNPWGIAIDSSGNFYVADRDNLRVQKFDSDGNFLMKFTSGNPKCYGIAVDSSGNVFCSDNTTSKIFKYSSAGTLITSWSCGGNLIYDIAIDTDNNIYIGDGVPNHKIKKYTNDGFFVTEWDYSYPFGFCFEV